MSTQPTTRPAFSTRRVARDAGWNLIGSVSPLAVALFAIPILISGLGIDRFGLLTLAWAAVGYFSFLDFGIGRALTQCVAESLTHRNRENVPHVFWGSLVVLGSLSSLGSCALCLVPTHFIYHILKIPGPLQAEARVSIWIMALTIPLVTLSATLRGFLEAHRRFLSINIVRTALGVATFVFPVLIVELSPTLPAVLGGLALARFGTCIAYVALCFQASPELAILRRLSWRHLRPVLAFGGWITLTNTISPVMTYLDRFFVSALLSLSAVSYYSTPYEITSKVQVLPAAIALSVFPAFTSLAIQKSVHLVRLYNEGVALVFYSVYPVSILLLLFTPEGLRSWLGSDFAIRSTWVVQVTVMGLLLNALAQIPAAFCQASGRPDVNAKFHLCELPVYIICAYLLTVRFGIVGAAVAGTIRITIDAALLFTYAHCRGVFLEKKLLITAGVLSALGSMPLAHTVGLAARVTIGVLVLTFSGFGLAKVVMRSPGPACAKEVAC